MSVKVIKSYEFIENQYLAINKIILFIQVQNVINIHTKNINKKIMAVSAVNNGKNQLNVFTELI